MLAPSATQQGKSSTSATIIALREPRFAPHRSTPADVRELIIQTENTDAAHESEERPTPSKIQARSRIDETVTIPGSTVIGVADGVLTTGAHFRAASAVLMARSPTKRIVGLFIARRVPEHV